MRDRIVFYLNGERHEAGPPEARMMLADFLRLKLGLSGTKVVCAEGDCGACTVLRRFAAPGAKGGADYIPINSCITRVAQLDGSSLVTVEGLAPASQLSPVQRAMVTGHGSQCGFCTPGFVVALTGLVEKKVCRKEADGSLQSNEIKNALTGNLCRCTGYQPIVDAASAIPLRECESVSKRHFSTTQGKALRQALRTPLRVEGEGFLFFAPTTLKAAVTFLARNKDARIVAGGTDLGVLQNKRKLQADRLLSLHLIPELYGIRRISTTRARVGARVTLSELREFAKRNVPELARYLDIFASPQIKNIATLAGNVGNASPIGDLPPFLLVAGTVITVAGPRGKREIPVESFFLGYRKTALRAGEFIVELKFDLPRKSETLALYKVSQRKDLDISTISAAFRAEWSKAKRGEGRKIRSFRFAMGGMAATPVRLPRTEACLTGAGIDADSLARAIEVLHSEVTPLSDLRGSAAFRRVLAENLLERFFRSAR